MPLPLCVHTASGVGFHIGCQLVFRSGPFFRSAAGFPVGIPGRLAQKKRPPSRLELGGHAALLQAYSIMKREHGISGLVNYHPCDAVGI